MGATEILQGKLNRFRVLFPGVSANLLGEYPVHPIANRPASLAWNHPHIPGNLFQTNHSKLVGKSHLLSIEQFRRQNPGVDCFVFDNAEQDAYMVSRWGSHPIGRIYGDCLFGPMAADLFRYCILWERGGFYLDIKSRFLKPLQSLLGRHTTSLVSYENRFCNVPGSQLLLQRMQHPTRLVLQWGMAFAPKHPFLDRLISNIVAYEDHFREVAFADPQAAICRFTGPGMFTQSLREHLHSAVDGGLKQLGVDFDGAAQYDMPGAWSRWALKKHYSLAKSQPILSSRH